MTWNYRIVRYRDGAGFGLHEVYYDEAGTATSRTVEPAGFVADAEEGSEGVVKSLTMALDDAKKHPVLDDDFEPRAKP